jgi:tungstate transport system ATP-binding protein
MIGGRIRQLGAPADVFSAPLDEEVAAFVGVETIVPANVVERSDGLVRLAAGAHVIEAVAGDGFERALVCLRPEDVSISAGGEHIPGSARNKLSGSVRRIVPSGADARVEIECGFTVIARVTRRSIDDLRLREGTPVVASFKATAVHLIPRQG